MRCKFFIGMAAMMLAAMAAAQDMPEIETFDIQAFEVVGNTILPAADIDLLVASFVGTKRNYGDIQQALEALEQAYRQRGYSAVQVYVPEQELSAGIVRLEVTETRIARVILPDDLKYYDADNLRAGLPALLEGTTPNTLRLSREIALNNENPAKQVEVILAVGEEEGQVDARIKLVEQKPLKFSFSLDNTGSTQSGRHRTTFGIMHANLFDRDHVLSANYVTSPEKTEEVRIGSFSYHIPLYEHGGAIDLIYAKSNVDSGVVAGVMGLVGKGDIFGIKYTQALPRQGEYSSKIFYGFDYKAYENNCLFLAGSSTTDCQFTAPSVTLRPFNIGYSGQILRPGQATDYNIAYYQNLPGGSKGGNAEFSVARRNETNTAGADAYYRFLRGMVSHLQLYPGDWQLRAMANWQWTDKPLLAYEQLGLAGSTSVRGFTEREISRDMGIQISIEGYTPEYAGLRGLAFIDAASGHNRLLPGESQPKSTIASYGLGLRYTLGRDLAARFDVARVASGTEKSPPGKTRGHFTLLMSF